MPKRQRLMADRKCIRRHPIAKVPCEVQRMVLELHKAGIEFMKIKAATKLNDSVITSIIEHGIITPQYTDVWKCMRCGAKVETTVCMACEVRRIGGAV